MRASEQRRKALSHSYWMGAYAGKEASRVNPVAQEESLYWGILDLG